MKKIIAAGGLVTNSKAELLMIFRRGFWDLPKGKLDKGETIEACAIREVQEETGIKSLELEKFTGITLHEYFDKYLKEKVIKETHWYAMKAAEGETLIPQTEEDIEEIKWVNRNELERYLELSYKNIVEVVNKYYLYCRMM